MIICTCHIQYVKHDVTHKNEEVHDVLHFVVIGKGLSAGHMVMCL